LSIWCGVLAAVVAAMAASTEWLRRSLRVWAGLVLIATAGALSMVGAETTSAVRADQVTAIGAETSLLRRRDCEAVQEARHRWRKQVDEAATTARQALTRIAAAQSPLDQAEPPVDQAVSAKGKALVEAATRWDPPADEDAACPEWATQNQSVTAAIEAYRAAKGAVVSADATVSLQEATTALDKLVAQLDAAAQTRSPADTAQVCAALASAGEAVGTKTRCPHVMAGTPSADTEAHTHDGAPCTWLGEPDGQPRPRRDRVNCQTVAVAEAAYRLAQYRDAVGKAGTPFPATAKAEQHLAEAKLLVARSSDTLPTLADDIQSGARTSVAQALAVLPGTPIPDIWVLALLAAEVARVRWSYSVDAAKVIRFSGS
jgi:hypothetical protein